MTAPISMGRVALPLTSSDLAEDRGGRGPRGDSDSILSAPTTPARRLPVVDKSKVDPQLLKAAEGMEAMFLDYMMKVMRQTVPKNDMDLDSPAAGIYQGMLDTETAQRAARAGGVGLADQIIAYMQPQVYNEPQGHTAPLADPRKVSPVKVGQYGGDPHASQSNKQRTSTE